MIHDKELINKVYSSLIATSVSTIICNPFDVVKIRLQAQQIKDLNCNSCDLKKLTNKYCFPKCFKFK